MQRELLYFIEEKDFIQSSAGFILKTALKNVEQKGYFTIALSGGTTPQKVFNELAGKKNFPWQKTYFFLGDERILPANNINSNRFMIIKTLFSKVQVPDKNKIFPNTELEAPGKIAKDYENRIKEFFKGKKIEFDLILLGMGKDCHTASMFPNDPVWKNSDKLVFATSKPIGDPEVHRVSFGLPLINKAKDILMLISGEEKRLIAEDLLANKLDVDSPILKIRPQDKFVWHINTKI